MSAIEQFFFFLVPAVIAGGGIAAAVLHRVAARGGHARRSPGKRQGRWRHRRHPGPGVG
ncbi:MAG: hypothetical protein IRY87_22705 [Acetobacteraceae bacterium]|nr:hypothetical protein [Acetobacteraceae bacterium]